MAKYILGLNRQELPEGRPHRGGTTGWHARHAPGKKSRSPGRAGYGGTLRRIQEIPILAVPTCQTSLAAKGFSFRNVKLPFRDREKDLPDPAL